MKACKTIEQTLHELQIKRADLIADARHALTMASWWGVDFCGVRPGYVTGESDRDSAARWVDYARKKALQIRRIDRRTKEILTNAEL
jgi:hypothetical protein